VVAIDFFGGQRRISLVVCSCGGLVNTANELYVKKPCGVLTVSGKYIMADLKKPRDVSDVSYENQSHSADFNE
jgi:hypothetical protein